MYCLYNSQIKPNHFNLQCCLQFLSIICSNYGLLSVCPKSYWFCMYIGTIKRYAKILQRGSSVCVSFSPFCCHHKVPAGGNRTFHVTSLSLYSVISNHCLSSYSKLMDQLNWSINFIICHFKIKWNISNSIRSKSTFIFFLNVMHTDNYWTFILQPYQVLS